MSFKAKTIKNNHLTKELQCALCNEYRDEVVINTDSNTGLCSPCFSKNRTDIVSEEVLQEGGEKEMPRNTNKDLRTEKETKKAKAKPKKITASSIF